MQPVTGPASRGECVGDLVLHIYRLRFWLIIWPSDRIDNVSVNLYICICLLQVVIGKACGHWNCLRWSVANRRRAWRKAICIAFSLRWKIRPPRPPSTGQNLHFHFSNVENRPGFLYSIPLPSQSSEGKDRKSIPQQSSVISETECSRIWVGYTGENVFPVPSLQRSFS
jgi:hypothetical protein